MKHQLPLALRLQHAPSLDDFIVGDNAAVFAALRQALGDGGERLIYLFGPAGCGRSHLLQGQCEAGDRRGMRCAYVPLADHRTFAPAILQGLENCDLIAVDDVPAIAGNPEWEHALFTLFNRCRETGTRLSFSADCGPASLAITLPDLRSRLAWGLTLAIRPLNETGRLALLQALARRRAMHLPEDVARYLMQRARRHPKDLIDVIDRLDRASLIEQRRLTIPFVRASLALDVVAANGNAASATDGDHV